MGITDKDVINALKDLEYNGKSKNRNLQVHTAVTIMPNINSLIVGGEKDREIGQWAVEIGASAMPVQEYVIDKCFEEMKFLAKQRMREYGLLK